jgi:hypothetical protein
MPGLSIQLWGILSLPHDLSRRTGISHARSIDEVASRDLNRYYRVIEREAYEADLSDAEALELVTALTGTLVDPSLAMALSDEIADHLDLFPDDGPDDLDGAAFVARLDLMPAARLMALCDAAERWFCLPDADRADLSGSFVLAGLTRDRSESGRARN